MAVYRLVLGIDGVEPAAQAARGEIAVHDAAERAFALGGADQRNAARREKRLQVMGNAAGRSGGQTPILRSQVCDAR